jgi:hypothetical protein
MDARVKPGHDERGRKNHPEQGGSYALPLVFLRLLFEVLFGYAYHEFDAVELVDLADAGVVVYGYDVA